MARRILGLGDSQTRLDSFDRVPGPRAAPTEPSGSNAELSFDQDSTVAFQERPPPVPPKPSQTRHGRSMSHPFPSVSISADTSPSVHTGEPKLHHELRDGRTMARQIDKGPRKAVGSNSKSFSTGNCMTCGSLVRWPSNVTVFKCTTCATVNDLEAVDERDNANRQTSHSRDRSNPRAAQKNDDTGRGMLANQTRKATGYAGLPGSVQPISLLHTKNIVRRCLYYYISRTVTEDTDEKLNHGQKIQSPSDRSQVYGLAGEPVTQQDAGRRFGAQFLNVPTQGTHNDYTKAIEKTQRSFSSGYSEKPAFSSQAVGHSIDTSGASPRRNAVCEPKHIFKALEEYIAECFQSSKCLNSSFMHHSFAPESRPPPEQQIRRKPVPSREPRMPSHDQGRPRGNTDTNIPVFEVDPKLLLLGDVAENGLWWTGGRTESPVQVQKPKKLDHTRKASSTARLLQMDWGELENWYRTITCPTEGWLSVFDEISTSKPHAKVDIAALENDLLQGQVHVHQALLKYTEMLLKRPRHIISQPADMRFLLIILENPLLHSGQLPVEGLVHRNTARRRPQAIHQTVKPDGSTAGPSSGPLSGQHSGIIKRVIGLISNSPPLCHTYLTSWWMKYDTERYMRTKDLLSGFLAYRMLRQRNKKRLKAADEDVVTSFLIPQMRSGQSGAEIHDEIGALSLSNLSKKSAEPEKITSYPDDWQVKAISRVLALVFAANDSNTGRETYHYHSGHQSGHRLPSSDFYVSMVDYIDLVKDFDTWEAKQGAFSFCQYPFLLSVGAKISILEHDTRRQMQSKARNALIDSIMSNKSVQQYLTLTVRRECLVDDSLMAVSEVLGNGTDDIKKGLRIKFRGEEGIDGGGLRKEWFQLVIRDIFNPDFGKCVESQEPNRV